MEQQVIPIFESLFTDGSFGYQPGRIAKDAILKVKEYAEQGYTHAVSHDLSEILRHSELHDSCESSPVGDQG